MQNTVTERNSHEKFTISNDMNSFGDFFKLFLDLRRATNNFLGDQNISLNKSQQALSNLNGTTIKSLVNAEGFIFQLFFREWCGVICWITWAPHWRRSSDEHDPWSVPCFILTLSTAITRYRRRMVWENLSAALR